MSSSVHRYKLVFFAPRANTQTILSHLFALTKPASPSEPKGVTVGRIGAYDGCAFVSPGTGQYLPGEGANPTIGQVGVAETVEEDRVETLIVGTNEQVKEVVAELKKVHPYEEVAYDVYKLEDF